LALENVECEVVGVGAADPTLEPGPDEDAEEGIETERLEFDVAELKFPALALVDDPNDGLERLNDDREAAEVLLPCPIPRGNSL